MTSGEHQMRRMGEGYSGAEPLRRAARLMRERAEAATPGRWQATVFGVRAAERSPVAPFSGEQPDMENRLHIASWHPAVALAVESLLSFAAEVWSDDTECRLPVGPDESCGSCDRCDQRWLQQRHLAVARAYLGESA